MTPAELRDYCFGTSLKGYNIGEVDAFLEEAAESCDKLSEENAELQKKIDFLLTKIEEYRAEEESLKTAIIGSQKLGDSMVRDATKRAEAIIREAELKSDRIVGTCKHTVDAQRFEYDRLRREINDFREKLIVTYKKHLEQIKDLPAFEDESDYPATMEDAIAAATPPHPADNLVKPDIGEDAAAEHAAPACDEAVSEPSKQDLGQDLGASEAQPAPYAADAQAESAGDTADFSAKATISKGMIENDAVEKPVEDTEDELFFGPGYDVYADDKKSKRRSIFGRKKDNLD